MALTHAVSTNNYGTAHLIVATSAANGTHTTLATAMADAVSGDTIFLRDSVTENVTLTAGVNIAAWTGGTLNTPSITGTLTMTAAGTCTISGIRLVTNSAALLAVTGTLASIVNLNNCYLNCSNNTGITFSTSSASARINIISCQGDIGTTGIALISHSSAGTMNIFQCDFTNTGASTTANTVSAGSLILRKTTIVNPITLSGTGNIVAESCSFSTAAQNVTTLTLGGSGTQLIDRSGIDGGTASAATISTTAIIILCTITSTNTNAITGAGTLNYSMLSFKGSSNTINTTTKTLQVSTPFQKVVTQVFTSDGTYTPTSGMKYCIIEMVGGGGGSGGVATCAVGESGVSAGGGGGEYARGVFSAATIGTSQSFTIGAAGAAGTAGDNTGGTGGTTSLGSTLMSAIGGSGGEGGTASAVGQANLGGIGGTGGTGGEYRQAGNPGGIGAGVFGSFGFAGCGGTSYFGGGALTKTAKGVGNTGQNYGSGGGGTVNFNGAALAGAAGAKGVIVITDYI